MPRRGWPGGSARCRCSGSPAGRSPGDWPASRRRSARWPGWGRGPGRRSSGRGRSRRCARRRPGSSRRPRRPRSCRSSPGVAAGRPSTPRSDQPRRFGSGPSWCSTRVILRCGGSPRSVDPEWLARPAASGIRRVRFVRLADQGRRLGLRDVGRRPAGADTGRGRSIGRSRSAIGLGLGGPPARISGDSVDADAPDLVDRRDRSCTWRIRGRAPAAGGDGRRSPPSAASAAFNSASSRSSFFRFSSSSFHRFSGGSLGPVLRLRHGPRPHDR